MEYTIYKFSFRTGVHFGAGTLDDSEYTFPADQLFSALYIEAIKMGVEQQLMQGVLSGKLLFSDLFPYVRGQYMIPKPMLYVEPKNRGISEQKKLFKKMKYIPINCLQDFLQGDMDLHDNPMDGIGDFQQQTMASVTGEKETVPFRVGTFYFGEDSGLYVLVAYDGIENQQLMQQLLQSLSYIGIGGKKRSGLGKYTLEVPEKIPEGFLRHLCQDSAGGLKMALSVSLPRENELEQALEGASYQLVKRSGYVASETFADEWRRKKDIYALASGSCFVNTFEGDVYDVAIGGNHPVYRYAKPLMLSVSGEKGERL